jgi:hypothetical protein
MRRLIFLISIFVFCTKTFGQFRFSDAEVLVLSRHYWRGQKLGDAPSIEPSVTFAANRFKFNVWGAVTTNNSYSELDLVPSYQFHPFKITLYDYYNPVPGESNSYFNFSDSLNRHSIELTLDNYAIEKQRFKWMVGTFLYGDKNKETGNPYFSTYLELKYQFHLFSIKTEPVLGFTPFEGYYADQFAVINTGVSFAKELDFDVPVKFPVKLSVLSNPYSKQTFVIFAAGIAFYSNKNGKN